MADVESSSSSAISQPPTSTSHINPIIPLIAADIHIEPNSSNIIGSVGNSSNNGASSSSPSSSSSSSSSSTTTNPINITTNQQQTSSSNVATVAIAASSIHSPLQPATSSSSNIIAIGDGNNNNNNNIIGGSNIVGGGGNNSSINNNNNNNNNTTTSTTNNNNCRKLGHDDEPEAKKIKLDHNKTASSNSGQIEKLESRLLSALCCAVCLDLPKTAMYQCQMGHLMCAACFSHLLADGRLRDQMATCPNCRIEISKSSATRNLAVEKAASELPSECQYCNIEYPYKSLERHEQHECQERPTNCKFNRIGCPWRGPAHETTEHESVCSHPHKSGYEVMSALEAHDAKLEKDKKVFSTLIDLLSYEKIIFNDLQLKPYRTDEYVHKLYYETSRFSAFNQQWVVKARINNSQRDPHQSNERTITYQLILKTKTSSPMSIHFFALKGPFSDMKVGTQIYKHDFTDQSAESEYYHLPLPDSSECNRLLSNKAINLRLLMFLLSK